MILIRLLLRKIIPQDDFCIVLGTYYRSMQGFVNLPESGCNLITFSAAARLGWMVATQQRCWQFSMIE